MTRILILLAMLAGSLISSAQSDSIVEVDFYAYFDAISERDYDRVWEYFPLEFEEIMDRQSLESSLELVYNLADTLMDMQAGDPDIQEIESLGMDGDKTYLVIDYNVPMTIDLGDELDDDEWKLMRASLAIGMNAKILNIKETEGPINYLVGKKVIAISDGQGPWKFFVLNPKAKFLWMPILPETIQEKL